MSTKRRDPQPARLPPLTETLGSPADDPADPSRSVTAHAGHFLARTLRCQREDQERAMRMYHHSELMRLVVPELLRERPEEPRVAVALREGPASPRVILTREGRFVTCLDETMATDLRTIPYALIEAKMKAEDDARGFSRRAEQQLAALPILRFARGLLDGYGHLTREMVETVLIEPRTYAVPVLMTFPKVYHRWTQMWQALSFHPEPRLVNRRRLEWGAACRLCLPLMGAMDIDGITDYLAEFLYTASTLEIDVIAALCRHRTGGEALLRAAEDEKLRAQTRILVADYLGNHLVHFPGHAPALMPRIRRLFVPEMDSAYHGEMRALYDRLLAAPEAAQVAQFQNQRPLPLPRPIPASRHYEITKEDYFGSVHAFYPVTQFFPPLQRAGDVRRRWAAHVQDAPVPPRQRSGKAPLVREAPKVGRNDACPCDSGRKHKHCCLREPAAPPATAPLDGAPA